MDNPASDVIVPDWGPLQSPPQDEPRSEHVHDIPLGAILQDANGANWIFFGWRQNSAGGIAHFVMEEYGFRHGECHIYRASIAATLEKKFPALAGMRKA